MSSAGAKSVMSDDIQNITEGKEDISNRASGYKATLSNPNVSDEAKKNAQEELKKLGGEDAFYGKKGDTQSESAAKNLNS